MSSNRYQRYQEIKPELSSRTSHTASKLDSSKDKYLDRLTNRALDTKYGSGSSSTSFTSSSRTSTPRGERDKAYSRDLTSPSSYRTRDRGDGVESARSPSRPTVNKSEVTRSHTSSTRSTDSRASSSSATAESRPKATAPEPSSNPWSKVSSAPKSLSVDTMYLEPTIPSISTSSKWTISASDLIGDDNTLIHVTESTVHVWNLFTEDIQLIFTGHTAPVHSVALLHTDAQIQTKLAISSSYKETLLWTIDTGNVIGALPPSDSMTVGTLNTRTNDVFLICLASANSIEFYVCNLKVPSRYSSLSYRSSRSKALSAANRAPTVELILLKDVKDKSNNVRFTSVDFLPSRRGDRAIKLLVGVTNGSAGKVFVFDLSKSEFAAVSLPPRKKSATPVTTTVRVVDPNFGVVSIGTTVSLLNLNTMECCTSKELPEPTRKLIGLVILDSKLSISCETDRLNLWRRVRTETPMFQFYVDSEQTLVCSVDKLNITLGSVQGQPYFYYQIE